MPRLEDLVKQLRQEKAQKARAAAPRFADLIESHPELQKTECDCGRPFSFAKMHCPFCGGAPMYSKGPIEAIMPDGTIVMADRYRCRKCPKTYTDHEVYFHCKALPPRKSAAERKAEEVLLKFTGGRNPEELRRQLIDHRIREGIPLGTLEPWADKKLEEEPKEGTPEYYEKYPEKS